MPVVGGRHISSSSLLVLVVSGSLFILPEHLIECRSGCCQHIGTRQAQWNVSNYSCFQLF